VCTGREFFTRKEVTVWCNKFKDGRTALNDDPEKHRSRPGTSHIDENLVYVDGLIKKKSENQSS
jgi:hypothetical protein